MNGLLSIIFRFTITQTEVGQQQSILFLGDVVTEEAKTRYLDTISYPPRGEVTRKKTMSLTICALRVHTY
jgi:hypothetical protein